MERLLYWLWLESMQGLGKVKIGRLLEHFGNPEVIWRADSKAFKKIHGLSDKDIHQLGNKDLDNAKKILETMNRMDIQAITIQDTVYPERLKHIFDPPRILFVRGELRPSDEAAIAVVGSRKASVYGKKVAETLSNELAQCGITVVSGMARGIDSFAHKGALKAGKRTIAVLGCGVDIVYPKENSELMGYIIKHGAVISEYYPGVRPIPAYFPLRNRIISGLSLGTVVIEAGEKSGSLITANLALEHGREVFAVPGNIDQPLSKGTNSLIKQGAKLVGSVDDILEEISNQISIINVELCNTNNNFKCIKDFEDHLSEEQKIIIRTMATMPLHIDEICAKTGFGVQKLNAVLTLLEIEGWIQQLPGQRFIRS